jgi:hypothetical protein
MPNQGSKDKLIIQHLCVEYVKVLWYVLIFPTMSNKKGIVFGVSCEGAINFPTLLLDVILIFIYLNHLN